ncbi:hypothetical protein [Chlamydia trachomatis]|uniref:hypothetical protein n=1 Tax=Chlamydia trachomatis TaxID=813 RepID=UPI000F4B9C90|nr:hypothetical protein [Chlamydia trachomatis]ROT58258.1 hypothetical protein DU07_0179 [Chlamydia trachomatis]
MKICREICDAIFKRDFATFEIERTYKNGSIVYTSRQCPGVEIREIGDQAKAILHNQEELRQAVATLGLKHLIIPPLSIYKHSLLYKRLVI